MVWLKLSQAIEVDLKLSQTIRVSLKIATHQTSYM